MVSIVLSVLTLASCTQYSSTDTKSGTDMQEEFRSKNIKGQWTMDRNTAMELRAMQGSIENFGLLIRKQPQNLAAYRGYADVLQNHIDRTESNTNLAQNTRSILSKDLDLIKAKVAIIEKGDIDQAHDAANSINNLFAHIDSIFIFDYQ